MDNPGRLEINVKPNTSKTKWRPAIALRGCVRTEGPASHLRSDPRPTGSAAQAWKMEGFQGKQSWKTIEVEGGENDLTPRSEEMGREAHAQSMRIGGVSLSTGASGLSIWRVNIVCKNHTGIQAPI